jgi:hypothetical protein
MTNLTTVDEFLAKAEHTTPDRRRLIFAIDATASRQSTWDTAAQVQGQMFLEAGRYGGLDVQLVFFRGRSEMKATAFMSNAAPLIEAMTGVVCRAGHTQLVKVLNHGAREHEKHKVAAAILVGDSCEEEFADIERAASQVKVPIYAFLEGNIAEGRIAFQNIAERTGGALIPFDADSPNQLRGLLGAVAAYIVGGVEALADHHPEIVALITHRSGT